MTRSAFNGSAAHLPDILKVAQPGDLVFSAPHWSKADIAKIPATMVHLTIATSASDYAADVLDVENGYATADQVQGWLLGHQYLTRTRGTIYSALHGQYPAIVNAVDKRLFWFDWLADNSSGKLHAIPGATLTQWAAYGSGGWNQSVVTDDLYGDVYS